MVRYLERRHLARYVPRERSPRKASLEAYGPSGCFPPVTPLGLYLAKNLRSRYLTLTKKIQNCVTSYTIAAEKKILYNCGREKNPIQLRPRKKSYTIAAEKIAVYSRWLDGVSVVLICYTCNCRLRAGYSPFDLEFCLLIRLHHLRNWYCY